MVPDDGYVVNVEVVVRRPAPGGDPVAGDGTHEYLFVVRSDAEDHAPGSLGFPGGTVEAEPGGSDVVFDTGRREVREEVGVAVENRRYVRSTTFETDRGRPCLNIVLRADHAGGEARVADPAEVAGVAWHRADEILGDESLPPWTRESLRAVLELGEA